MNCIFRSKLPLYGILARHICDNGPAFTGQMMDLWTYRNEVKIDFSRPGKPTDNAFVNRSTEPSA